MISPLRLAFLCLLLPLSIHGRAATISEPVVPFKLHGDAPFHCWTLGQPVVFRVVEGELPPDVTRLVGTVKDYAERKVAEIEIDRTKFLADGWQWNPAQPGYYEVSFLTYNSDRATAGEPVERPFSRFARHDPKNPATAYRVWYQRTTYDVAITATPPRSHENRLAQFGFCAPISAGQTNVGIDAPLADWMGFGFVRLHGIFWGGSGRGDQFALEPQRGVFNWKPLDQDLDLIRPYGFAMVGNIFNTPKWASPHPEDTSLHICVLGYQEYAPTDLNDWTTFLHKLVERYGSEIKTWEIWNEPHLPGYSVFWNDTPDHFVQLLTAGYKTIKSEQPDSEIWLGGMGDRYLPFYKAILSSGANPYYDRLAIHGSGSSPEGFWRLDKKAGMAPKPWVNSEWHAILVATRDVALLPKLPSEADLSHGMILDLLRQFKEGVQRTTLFTLSNSMEYEMLPDCARYSWYGDVAGIFRQYPCVEPRLSAVVLRTFLDRIDKKIAYRAEYDLDDGQKAVLLETGGKTLIGFWTEAAAAQPPAERLAKAIGPASRILDWVGTPREKSGFVVDPGTIYWLTCADASAFAGVPPNSDILLSKDERQKVKGLGPTATAQEKRLFETPQNVLLHPETIVWNTENWSYEAEGKAPRPDELSAKFAVGWEKTKGIDLVVEVDGGSAPGNSAWKESGVQFAFGTDENGLPGDRAQFRVAIKDGNVVITKTMAPYIGGDLPSQWTSSGQEVRYGSAAVEQMQGGATLYKVHLEWSELYPVPWESGQPVPYGLVVCGKDGAGHLANLEWSGGIKGGNASVLTGSLRP